MLGVRFEDLPAPALDTTQAQLHDTVGVALAGRRESGVRELRELAAMLGGKGKAPCGAAACACPAMMRPGSTR